MSKTVFWGAGRIAKLCMEQYPEVRPDFFIDQNPEGVGVDDYEIVSPDKVKDWDNLFIIVTIWKYDAVMEWLSKKGLKEGLNYIDYETYFRYDKRPSSLESVEDIQFRVSCYASLKRRTIIMTPFFGVRGSDRIRSFFSNYIAYNGKENFLLLNGQNEVNTVQLEKVIGCSAVRIRIPLVADNEREDLIFSDEEIEFAEMVDEIKQKDPCIDSAYEYSYFKRLLDILEPTAFIMWGGWFRESFMLEKLAEMMGIKFFFGEHGWIPGTIQLDRKGIAGKSELCMEYKQLNGNMSIQNNNISIIKSIIVNDDKKKEWDINEREKAYSLKRIPTVLLVGMADDGMGINPKSDFWHEYISEIVKGTRDAFYRINRICKKNNWNLIFKPHPLEMKGHEYYLVEESDITKQFFNTPIEKLIELADVVVSITSAVDFKTPFYDKPLVQLGKNVLNNADCTYVVKRKEDIEIKVKEALENGFTDKQRQNYIKLLDTLLNTTHWDDMMPRQLRYGKSCNYIIGS